MNAPITLFHLFPTILRRNLLLIKPVQALFALILMGIAIAACAPPAATPPATTAPRPTTIVTPSAATSQPTVIAATATQPPSSAQTATPAATGLADVEFVKAVQAADGSWTFSVTVRHPDTGWEDYADGWDVMTPDGQVLKAAPDDPFTRLLLHPHVKEQPFTRSQSRIVIPDGVTRVTVRAHSLTRGFGGREIVVDLTQSSGEGFEVQRAATPESRALAAPAVYTYPRPDGNHLVQGSGSLPDLQPLDIPLTGTPLWVVGMPWRQGVVWAVALENGEVEAFHVTSGTTVPFALTPATLPAGMPPALTLSDDAPTLLVPPAEASPLTHPVTIPGGMAYVAQNGDLVLMQGGEATRLAVNALPDARILSDGADQLLLLTDPTDRYPHGVLGDALEAGSATLVGLTPPAILTAIALPDPWVVEGITPLWADITGDGQREIILTRSSMDTGAQIAVYDQTGTLLGTSAAIGQGRRWRHIIAVASFAPDGVPELVDVLTPHIGGPVEFFRWRENSLTRVARATGYTSHVIYTRNMDMAVAGNFDGAGSPALLTPNLKRDALGAIRRDENGAAVVWTLPLDGVMVTNLSAVSLPGTGLALAAGRADGVLRIWQP